MKSYLASKTPKTLIYNTEIKTKFLDSGIITHLEYFSKDMKVASVEPNNLDRPILLDYYLEHWNNLNNEPK